MGGRIARALQWIGLVVIASIAVMRCLTVFAPQLFFDVDPAFDQVPLGGLGPAGSLTLDVILMLGCAIAVAGVRLSGKALDWPILILSLVPLPIVLWHGAHDAGDLWRGATWVSAALACAAVAHLASDRIMRVVLLAILLSAFVPILVRGVGQVTFEHADTVAYFDAHRDQILRDRGWSPDSSAARIYERRLRQPQPLGWFATSNIFASLAGFAAVLCLGLATGALRTIARRDGGVSRQDRIVLIAGACTMLLLGSAAAVMLCLSGSKGAILAMAAGLATWAALEFDPASRLSGRLGAHVARAVLPMLMVGTLLAVVVRGAVLPESFAADKSLLFRWHYMIASERIIAEAPLTGVGPDGFQASYTQHRPPRNPEEVSSAHSVFLDWLCALGIAGAAWMTLVVVLPTRTANPVSSDEPERAPPQFRPAALGSVVAVLALGLLPARVVESPTLDDSSVLVRIIGAVGFGVVAVVAAHAMIRVRPSHVHWSMIGAAGALLVHGQIEMTMTQPGAAVWSMAVVGLLGGGQRGRGKAGWPAAVLWTSIVVGAAIWLAVKGAAPALRQERAVAQAAAGLQPIAREPADARLALQRRQAAAEQLVRAYEVWPSNVKPLEAAVIQLELIPPLEGGEAPPLGPFLRALDLIDRAIAEHGRPSSIALAVGVNTRLAELTGDVEYWRGAIHHARRLTEIDPHGVAGWKRLGDVLWLSGEKAEASAAYQRALERSANFELDELKQLSAEQIQVIQRRIDEVKAQEE